MKITAIKQQARDENRVSIFVDGAYSVSLTLDQLLEQKLKKHDEIDKPRMEELKKLSDNGKVRQRALEWLLRRPHSQKELRDYLFKKQVDGDFASTLIQEFLDKNYLDDESFARWFVEQRSRKHKSSRAVTAELMSKGVSREVIAGIFEGQEDSDEESLSKLIQKMRTRKRYQDDKKLTAYLLGKGFRYSDVREAIDRDMSSDS